MSLPPRPPSPQSRAQPQRHDADLLPGAPARLTPDRRSIPPLSPHTPANPAVPDSPANPADELDRLNRLHTLASRLERHRRMAVMLMYSPVLFLCLLVGLFVSSIPHFLVPGPNPRWILQVASYIAMGLMLSLPLSLAGMAARTIASARLRAFARRTALGAQPPLPTPGRGEQFGLWRCETIDASGFRLRRRLAPPLLWWPVLWGVTSLVTLLTIITIITAVRAGGSAGFFGALMVLMLTGVWCLILLRLVMDVGVFVGSDARGPCITLWSRWHPLFPRFTTRIPAADIASISIDRQRQLLITSRTGRSIILSNFAPSGLGTWQARRIAAAAAAILRVPSTSGVISAGT